MQTTDPRRTPRPDSDAHTPKPDAAARPRPASRRAPPRRAVVVSAIGLAALIAVQYFDGSTPIWFWIVGILRAFGCMYLTFLFGAGTEK